MSLEDKFACAELIQSWGFYRDQRRWDDLLSTFHPDGEIAVARAARAGNHLQILSTSSNYSVEDVTKARGAPIWFQLYASPKWEVAQALIKRADAAGW